MVLPDRGMSEIRVAPKDLRLWQDRGGPSDVGQSDGVQLMDFVQIDSHNFGVVTQVDRESISILTCLGKVVTVKANTALRVMKFGGPRGAQPQALDRNGNVIQVMFTNSTSLFSLFNCQDSYAAYLLSAAHKTSQSYIEELVNFLIPFMESLFATGSRLMQK